MLHEEGKHGLVAKHIKNKTLTQRLLGKFYTRSIWQQRGKERNTCKQKQHLTYLEIHLPILK